jgi:hypothetical protein
MRSILVTSLRCWWRIWPLRSPIFLIGDQLYIVNITTSPTSLWPDSRVKMALSVCKLKRVFWVWVWQIAKSFIASESDSKILNKSKKYEVLIGWKFFHFRASHWLFFIFMLLNIVFHLMILPFFEILHWSKLNAEKCFGFGLYKFGSFSVLQQRWIWKPDLVWFDFFGFCHFNISKIQIRILQAHQTNDFEILVRSEPITIVQRALVVSTITFGNNKIVVRRLQ